MSVQCVTDLDLDSETCKKKVGLQRSLSELSFKCLKIVGFPPAPLFFGGKNIQQAVMQMAGNIQLVPKALPTLTSRMDH